MGVYKLNDPVAYHNTGITGHFAFQLVRASHGGPIQLVKVQLYCPGRV